ncbi:NAD(P)-dependent oxidoreductase [Arthrospira platensis SPKY2]
MFETNIAFPMNLIKTAIKFDTGIFFNTDTYFSKGKSPYPGAYTYSMSKQHFRNWGKQLALKNQIIFANVSIEHPFGANDYDYKFIPYLIRQLLNNVPEIELTSGKQKRDFIHVDDVVSAYAFIIDKAAQQASVYQKYELGTGQAISLREFIEIAKAIANSKTKLKFGALPLREAEIMFSQANIQALREIGWHPAKSWEEGLIKTIETEKTLN